MVLVFESIPVSPLLQTRHQECQARFPVPIILSRDTGKAFGIDYSEVKDCRAPSVGTGKGGARGGKGGAPPGRIKKAL